MDLALASTLLRVFSKASGVAHFSLKPRCAISKTMTPQSGLRLTLPIPVRFVSAIPADRLAKAGAREMI